MNNQPLVSVIITTYKRADMLDRSITSVLNQTYDEIELIVVDDNDPNTKYRANTEDIMKKYQDNSKIKYIQHESNINGAAARNTGINASSGKYITFLDDDDVYYNSKIKEQALFLESKVSYDAVYCGWNRDGIDEIPSESGNLSFQVLSGDVIILTNTIMMRTKIAKKIGGWDETYRRHQEVGFLMRFFDAGYKIGLVDKSLIRYDMTDRSNASNPVRNEEDTEYMLSNQQNRINKFSKKDQKYIYSNRFKSIFLNYLKNKKYLKGLEFYIKATIKYPVTFNVRILSYLFRIILIRSIF